MLKYKCNKDTYISKNVYPKKKYVEYACLERNRWGWEWNESESHSVVSDCFWLHGQSMEFSRPEHWRGKTFLQGIFPTQESNPGLPHSRQILYHWAERKPKNTEVGSLSLLQGIFPTQGSNRGLLHCRQILYQLSYQEEWRIGSKEENKIKWNKQHKIGVRLKTDKQMGELRES